ncbi:MAG: glycerol-3-phosphate dehydrogenase/oxidase [Candidatus Nanopelagicales bacterium]|jgi:glycerol-3-phosphate dehydrogenase
MDADDRLDRDSRAQSIAFAREHRVDIVIIGGGVVGCGAALDAAARGLSVVLLEQSDLAAGTSSRSSRLAHGGLRYLEQREFSLVHEALTERGLLLDRLAPHLVRPVPFLFPVGRKWERPYVASGVRLYDVLSRIGSYGGTMPRPKSLNVDETKQLAPDLDAGEIAGAVRFHDAQIDDARHTVAVARTAASFGAHILTRTRVDSLSFDDEGRVTGVKVRDELSGDEYAIRSRVVIAAAGVWTDEILHMVDPDAPDRVQQSRGVHLVVRGDAIRSTTAIIARTPASVLFLLPWGGDWIVGTTDTPREVDESLANPVATEEEIAYLLGQANRWLARPLRREDVIATYAGYRPLVTEESAEATTQVSREHVIFHPAPGLVSIAGGKYTTYRVMAADAVDAAVAELDEAVPASTTADIPLVGAVGFVDLWADRAALAERWELPVTTVERLLRRYGSRVSEIFDVIAADPGMRRPLPPEGRHIAAEAVVAVTHQGASDLEDVLVRRLRLTAESPDAGREAAAAVAPLIAPLLGWDDSRVSEEIAAYSDRHPLIRA